MSTIRTVVVLAVVGVAAAGLLAPGVGADVVGVADDGSADEEDGEPPMGSHVSAFMQTSTATVDEAVESGMFEAAFERADEDRRAELVANRTDALERKAQRLREEYESLQERDDLPKPAYDARMARLATQINSLERQINRTEPRAVDVGVATDELDRLRENASSLAGPEVAEAARKVVGVEPPRGPPEGVGNGSGPGVSDGANHTPPGQSDSGPPHGGSSDTDAPPGNETPSDGDTPPDNDTPAQDPPGEGPPGDDHPGEGPPDDDDDDEKPDDGKSGDENPGDRPEDGADGESTDERSVGAVAGSGSVDGSA